MSPRSSFSIGGSIEEDQPSRESCEEEELPAQYRVCVLGPHDVGKTTLIHKFRSTKADGETLPTLEILRSSLCNYVTFAESDTWLAVMLEGIESVLVFTEMQSEDMVLSQW